MEQKYLATGSQANHARCCHVFTFKYIMIVGIKYQGELISSNQVKEEFVLCVLVIWKVVPDLCFG
jgi:hypothetical protein